VGYNEEEILNMSLIDITHPGDKETSFSNLSQLKEGNGKSAFEKRYITKQGEVVWVIIAANPVFGPKGRIKHNVAVIHDITRRKYIEQSLERLATHLKISTDSARAGTWVFDVATETLEWSDLHKVLWGYDIDRDGLCYEDWYHCIHPEDVDEVFRNLDHARLNHSMYEAEYRITRQTDGAVLWMHSVGQYLYNEKKEPVSATGITIDITEKKNREKELLEVKEQLELTVRNVPAGIMLYDKKMNVVFANDRASAFLSLTTPKALLDIGIDDVRNLGNKRFIVFDEWNNQIFDEGSSPVKKAFETGRSSEGSFRIQFLNGEKSKWVFYTCNPLLDEKGEASMVLSTLTDITTQKDAEQRIRQSEQQLRTLAESIPQLVWMSDEMGNCEYKTGRWFEYSGLSIQDKDILERMIHPNDFKRLELLWSSSMQNGNTFKDEVRLRNKKGEYRWHALSGEPIRNADGRISKWIGVFTDIDEQKISAAKLEQLVTQRTSELQRSNEDLQQFAHVASHDLKEPLRKIKIFGTRLTREYEHDLPEPARRYLAKIEGAANRMFAMIDGVLQYSTLNASLQQPEKVDLNGVMESIESDLEVSIEDLGAAIRYDRLPTIEGAPVLIYQLLYNLVNNSLKFSKETERPVISVSSENWGNEENPTIKLVIEDNGIGFEQEYAEKIFNSFSRLNTKDRYEGTGLGLALCKKIVERHHGSIEAKGVPGVGAVFAVYFPLNQHGQMI
jgi:PAS domain S-box-containing protein